MYGDEYYGYSSWNRQVLFYEFACQGYDLRFKYHDKWYYAMAESEYYSFFLVYLGKNICYKNISLLQKNRKIYFFE